MTSQTVVRAATLKAFLALVSTFYRVFAFAGHRIVGSGGFSSAEYFIILSAAIEGQVVTLTISKLVSLKPHSNRGWTSTDESMQDSIPVAFKLLKDYLSTLGYTVIDGQIAIDQNLKESYGDIEVLRWEKNEEGLWSVSLHLDDTEEETAPQ